MIQTRARRRRLNGFTLLEVMVVSVAMGLLVLVLSGAWSGLGRPSADALVRCRVAQEANLAAASLARDFGGSLPDQTTGRKQSGWLVGLLVVDDSQLWLCFDGEPVNGVADWASPDTVITYEVQDDRLIRSNQQTETTFPVASNVEQMQLSQQAEEVEIELTFTYRDITRTYTIIGKNP